MLELERHKIILNLLKQSGFISVKEMVGLLGASEATVRRDLAALALKGHIRRLRGGAELIDAGAHEYPAPPRLAEMPLEYRKRQALDKKRAIARKAVELIEPEETVIIDGGSTTYWMAEFLTGAHLKVITNSFAIAEYLLRNSSNTVICAGGIIYPDSMIILNPFDNDILKHYCASKVFMGVRGLDERGATNSDPMLIRAEQEMIQCGRELILLVDSSKFENRGPLFLCGYDRITTVITDQGIPDRARDMLLSHNVKLIVA